MDASVVLCADINRYHKANSTRQNVYNSNYVDPYTAASRQLSKAPRQGSCWNGSYYSTTKKACKKLNQAEIKTSSSLRRKLVTKLIHLLSSKDLQPNAINSQQSTSCPPNNCTQENTIPRSATPPANICFKPLPIINEETE